MFDAIGEKIKSLARILFWIGVLFFVFLGLVLIIVGIADGNAKGAIAGLMLMVAGALSSWINSFLLYGFGQLIDNSDRRTELAEKQVELAQEQAKILDEISTADE